jgi:HEAT repeat protein
MRLLRSITIVAAFLLITISISPALFSQTAPKRPATRQRQPKRSQRADALATAIKELLKTDPLAPESPDEKASDGNAPEDKDKPPADDAPIKEFVDYWVNDNRTYAQTPEPSDRVRQRLLEAVEDRPELFNSLVNYLPKNTDTHDRLYKLLNEESEDEWIWKFSMRIWLTRNSAYFRDDLMKASLAVEDNIVNASVSLRSLARLDWNAAKPVLESFASAGNSVSTPVALTLLYEHEAKEGDSARAENYRALLKAVVENRKSQWDARMASLMSLAGPEWSGQEEWFISLFADPTLSGFSEAEIEPAAESKDGSSVKYLAPLDNLAITDKPVPLTGPGVLDAVLLANTDRWLPVVSNLVGHNQRTVHKAAVKCMVRVLNDDSTDEKKKEEIARKLIPWLTGSNWTADENLADFIRSLAELNMPELAPWLIQVLDDYDIPEIRAYAAEALTKYRGPRAVPALRRALEKEKSEAYREKIVTAMAECGGLSDDEMAEAVEAYARKVALASGFTPPMAATDVVGPKEWPLKVSMGRILTNSDTIRATEGLGLRLIERAKALRATEPDVAREILRSIENTPLRAAEMNLVERIGEGWADVDSIKLALETRDELIKSADDALNGLIKEGGYAAGVAAAILSDEREWKAILENGDAKAQLALLACARYLRDKLPVEPAGGLLNSPNRALAKAAESYLEIEDGAEARKLVLARHPGEAYILGDLTAISGDPQLIEAARTVEDKLRKETLARNGAEAIYAVMQISSPEDVTGVIIRVRDGKAEMSVHETVGRRNVRWLTGDEFAELKSLTSRPEIEELGPERYPDENSGENYEYLRLAKETGRRIVLADLHSAPKNPTLHEELSGFFYRLSKSGEFTARYDIEDKIPGVEVVFADKNQSVLKVCAESGAMRTLIQGKDAEYRRGGAMPAPEWREFSSGKPGEITDEPSACRKLKEPSSAPKNSRLISPNLFGRPAQSDEEMFYVKNVEDAGIWKVREGLEPVKIVSGDYDESVVTPDGKWLVAFKQVTEERKTSRRLIRRNLQSGEEFAISLPQYSSPLSLTYVAAHGKVVAAFSEYNMDRGSGYLVDQETGTVQPVKGEFRPLPSPNSHTPQQGGAPNLLWTAIFEWEKSATRFGRYDSKNFSFTPLLEFPAMRLSEEDFWVDAAGGKIWFVYQGHLLRLPIPTQMK